MSNTKKGTAAARKKGAAARAERNGKPPTLDFRGLTLELPAKMPGDVAFAMADVEQADDNAIAPVIELVRSLVGREQLDLIRAKLRDDQLDLEQTVEELGRLVRELLEELGTNMGESSASPTS